MGRAKGRQQDFERHEAVRYRPGTGTYGYEDGIQEDGRIPATVVGHSRTRVRIEFRCGPRLITRCVDATSLQRAESNHAIAG